MTIHRPPLGLHIGLPRTGTKTLEWQLFTRHPHIHYMGLRHRRLSLLWPRRPLRYRSEVAREFFESQLFGSMDLDAIRRIWQKQQAEVARDQTIVWSLETLSRGPLALRRGRAKRIWRLLRPCNVIFTLREPITHLESVYAMLMRGRLRRSIDETVQPIDAWFEDPQESPFAKFFDHAETVRAYRELFGPESVKVMLFEKLQQDPRGFFAEVSEHLGIDAGVGAELYADRVDNARISQRQIRMGIWLRQRPALWTAVQRLGRGFRTNLLYRTPRKASTSSQVLSPANADRVRELSRPSNRWFREEFGLEVEEYGYTV
ncbi:MAG: sulfotransferase [Acidobacteriota bacterium]|nr:sulfotransferase [Acidobacteriota bacterium]